MILFISDVHLGRSGAERDRAVERDLIACLEAHRETVDHLYILGDLFDEYIEYRRLVPKGFVRLQGLLASWTDDGIPITYLVGNHDPWHLDYFQRELGTEVAYGPLIRNHQECSIYLAHGDVTAKDSTLSRWITRCFRHPVPVWIYRTFLPADAGLWLAQTVNNTFGKRDINWDLVERLRVSARRTLDDHSTNMVIFGHSHFPEHLSWPEGVYLNTGYWHESRTFARLEDGELQLLRWNGRSAEVVQHHLKEADSF